jgi:hypothetical protein
MAIVPNGTIAIFDSYLSRLWEESARGAWAVTAKRIDPSVGQLQELHG